MYIDFKNDAEEYKKYVKDKNINCHRIVEKNFLDLENRLIDCMPKAVTRGYMTKEDLLAVAYWKTRLTRGGVLVKKNEEEEVIEISEASFATTNSHCRIKKLMQLKGIRWAMASAILHFAYPDQYPILDTRAVKTFCKLKGKSHNVGNCKSYNLKKWDQYTGWCVQMAHKHNLSMRDLDRALWYYNKKNC